MDLRSRWHNAWAVLQASPAPGLLEDLLARYNEPHRRYHTVRHLEECFRQFDLLEPLAAHPAEISLGLWFHDAIYDTRRHDNEERSAEWARSAVPAMAAKRVHGLVMATRHAAVPRDIDAQVLVDVDLSILGSRPERFDESDPVQHPALHGALREGGTREPGALDR